MLAQWYPFGLHGTAGHHGLSHFAGLHAWIRHGIRLQTVLQPDFPGELPGPVLLPPGPRPLPGRVPGRRWPCLPPLARRRGFLPAYVGFLTLRGPPRIWCCLEPGCGWPWSHSL